MIEIYHDTVPEFLREFAQTKEMLRLKDIGMDCGCEYTSFGLWKGMYPYRRYEHSLGVALIVYHFTGDIRQSVAALFHDIASPVFAHVVDFMNHDYLKQESTEGETRRIIENSEEIKKLLIKYGLSVEDVYDYHRYPIADNDTPRLSADRLEYSLENMSRAIKVSDDKIKAMYDDLTAGKNEEGQDELMFVTPEPAHVFTICTTINSWNYVSDEDRYSMELLARILRKGLDIGVLKSSDLYTTETNVINKLKSNSITESEWTQYCAMTELRKRNDQPDETWLMIDAKKRYIDPYVKNMGRASAVFEDCCEKIREFTDYRFDYYVKGF